MRENKVTARKPIHNPTKRTSRAVVAKETNALESYVSETNASKTNTSGTNTSKVYVSPRQEFIEPEVLANFQYGRPLVEQWKENIIKALTFSGVSFRKFYPIITANGIKMCRQRFYKREMKRFPNFLYIITFSRLLGIETHYLLRSDFDKLLESGEVKPSILGIHRQE